MHWYTGPTLIEKLKMIPKEPLEAEFGNPLFICIDKQFTKFVEAGHSRILRGKILQGTLHKGSVIKISPVKYKDNEFITITAKVREIHYDRGGDTEIAQSGDLVGINLDDIRIDNRRCEQKDWEFVETSCVVLKNTSFLIGNVLKFRISSDNNEIDKFWPMETVMILWFGRFVS